MIDEKKVEEWKKLILQWDKKMPNERFQVNGRNVYFLLTIARVLDPNISMGLPPHHHMQKACQIYDALLEESQLLMERGYCDNVLPESLWPAQT